MIAVIHKYKSSIAYIPFKILPLLLCELHQFVAAKVTKGTMKDDLTV